MFVESHCTVTNSWRICANVQVFKFDVFLWQVILVGPKSKKHTTGGIAKNLCNIGLRKRSKILEMYVW